MNGFLSVNKDEVMFMLSMNQNVRKPRRRYIAGVLVMLVTAVIALTAFPEQALACKCMKFESALAAKEKANMVVQGTVLNVKREKMNGKTYNAALIEVKQSWKGTNQSNVIVYTDLSTCGFEFIKNQEYLLFTREDEGIQVLNLCSGSKLIADAQQELKDLGAGTPPVPVTSPMNTIQQQQFEQQRQFIEPIWLIGYGVVAVLLILTIRFWIKNRRK